MNNQAIKTDCYAIALALAVATLKSVSADREDGLRKHGTQQQSADREAWRKTNKF